MGDGFIPKKAKGDKIRYLEYGLSHVIWRNFLPELRNAANARNAKDNLAVMLGILRFIYDGGARIRFWVPPNFPGNLFILQMMCFRIFKRLDTRS
jgi:hypothetical protein